MKRTRPVPIARVVAGLASAFAAVMLASACADEEILLAKLPPGFDAGGGGSLRCVDETGCTATEFCSRGQCFDVGGACETRPRFCTEDAVPVCGCDGITYWNDCFRKTAGVTAMTPGECTSAARKCGFGGGPHGGQPGADDRCPAGVFCARLLPSPPEGPPLPPMCPFDVPGTCWALPPVCPARADLDRWIGCKPGSSSCVTTCDAIRTGEPFRRAKECF